VSGPFYLCGPIGAAIRYGGHSQLRVLVCNGTPRIGWSVEPRVSASDLPIGQRIRVEVRASVERRQRWSAAEKERLLRRS
jgi:hypothetical protein